METPPNRIVLMCMDARMNVIADSLNDGRSIFLRNAAGNPQSAITTLEGILSNYPIQEIIYMPHTDCGACKFTYGLLSRGESSTQEIEDNLVSTIRFNVSNPVQLLTSPQEVIDLLKESGSKFLKSKYPNTHIKTSLADTSTTVTGEKHMLILPPSTEKYFSLCNNLDLPIASTYVSQSNSISNTICDVQLASSALGIKKFTILPKTNNTLQEEHEVRAIKDALKSIPSVKITLANNRKTTSPKRVF